MAGKIFINYRRDDGASHALAAPQRPGRHFRRRQPIARDRDRAVPRLRLQSHGKLKAIPNAPGNGLCAMGAAAVAPEPTAHADQTMIRSA
jgi:hypothetical protein